jgi:hypothetical protein
MPTRAENPPAKSIHEAQILFPGVSFPQYFGHRFFVFAAVPSSQTEDFRELSLSERTMVRVLISTFSFFLAEREVGESYGSSSE